MGFIPSSIEKWDTSHFLVCRYLIVSATEKSEAAVLKAAFYLFLALGVFAVAGIISEEKKDLPAGSGTVPASAARAAPDPDDIVPTPALKASAEQAIREAGFVCPSANGFRRMGLGVRGSIIRVWCGPPGGSDVYQNLVYRFDLHPNGSGSVRPWEGSPHKRPSN